MEKLALFEIHNLHKYKSLKNTNYKICKNKICKSINKDLLKRKCKNPGHP